MNTGTAAAQILRPAEAARFVGISRSSAYALEAAGKFPKRRKLSQRCSGYVRAELEAWLQSRPLARE